MPRPVVTVEKKGKNKYQVEGHNDIAMGKVAPHRQTDQRRNRTLPGSRNEEENVDQSVRKYMDRFWNVMQDEPVLLFTDIPGSSYTLPVSLVRSTNRL